MSRITEEHIQTLDNFIEKFEALQKELRETKDKLNTLQSKLDKLTGCECPSRRIVENDGWLCRGCKNKELLEGGKE